LKTTPKIFDFKPLQNIFMKQTLSFLGCKQPFSRTSFVAGGDFVLNTCNGGKTISTKQLANGVYYLHIYLNNKLIESQKLIIAK